MNDQELEAAIDSVGRDRVFARARSLGWSVAMTPEKWVWWGIVAELRDANRPGNTDNRLPTPPRLVTHTYCESRNKGALDWVLRGLFG